MNAIDPHVFRAYDIRGIAHENITEELCVLIGKAFGSELRKRYHKNNPVVIVGRDARVSSQALEQALITGLTSSGCEVKTIGEVPSPVNYFALCHFEADGSVQVTASHNPKEDNGLKLQLKNAEAFAGEELQQLRKSIEEENFLTGAGSIEHVNGITSYRHRVSSLVTRQKPQAMSKELQVVADFGNGVAGPVYSEILKSAGIDLIALYAEPDGAFPNHIADPSNFETLKDLQKTVKEEKANCGIAFDGDGDRIGFVDERGEVVPPEYLLLLLAEDYLKRHPNSPIVYTVSMSSILETEVRKLGGKPLMCPVGHSFVEHLMREHGSKLGGEQSGHFFCGEDYFSFDDALVAALRVLSLYSQYQTKNQKLKTENSPTFSSLLSHYPKVYQSPEWRPHCPDDKKADVIHKITEHFQRDYPCVTLDGVRIDFGDGAWAGIRQSNTSPKLSVCMEARSKEKLQFIEEIVLSHLKSYEEIST